MTADRRPFVLTPRVVTGLLIVLVGVILTLDNLGVYAGRHLLRYWPYGLVLVGLAKIVLESSRSSRMAGALLMALGGVFAAEMLGVRVQIWRWWPIAIVLFGLMILSRALRPGVPDREGPGFARPAGEEPQVLGAIGSTRTGTLGERISEFAVWSGLQRRVTSPRFRRADLVAIMGGIELDLRQAGTETGEAVVDVFVLWGGIEITVPPDWAVANEVTPILGGAEDRSTGTQQARHRLVVKGVVIMGGVDIKT